MWDIEVQCAWVGVKSHKTQDHSTRKNFPPHPIYFYCGSFGDFLSSVSVQYASIIIDFSNPTSGIECKVLWFVIYVTLQSIHLLFSDITTLLTANTVQNSALSWTVMASFMKTRAYSIDKFLLNRR